MNNSSHLRPILYNRLLFIYTCKIHLFFFFTISVKTFLDLKQTYKNCNCAKFTRANVYFTQNISRKKVDLNMLIYLILSLSIYNIKIYIIQPLCYSRIISYLTMICVSIESFSVYMQTFLILKYFNELNKTSLRGLYINEDKNILFL